MKVTVPAELKSTVPQTMWGKILVATPVIMTVIATMLAGLASSEMTRAQYDRSLAAQQQSKAGDQWSYFQAKKLRGAMQRSTLDVLQGTLQVKPLDAASLPQSFATNQVAVRALLNSQLPDVPEASFQPQVKNALQAVENSKPDDEVLSLLASVKVTRPGKRSQNGKRSRAAI